MAAKKKATKKAGARSARRAAPKKTVKKTAAKKISPLRDVALLPKIGDRSGRLGGVYMGIARGENGQPDCHIFRGRYAEKRMNHAAALKFAADCRDSEHADWKLPNRTEGALVYANGREDMRQTWHWLEPQYAGDDACAWCQYFRSGYQDDYLKSNEFEVVLVRRVPIQ
jgi:hypothetical protein